MRVEGIPSIGQLHVDVALQQDSEEVHIVVPRLTPLLQGWLRCCIQMTVAHFLHAVQKVSLDAGHNFVHVHHD